MNFKFTIAKKLILGFGIVTIAILNNIFLINNTLRKSIEVNKDISTIYVPSADLMRELSNTIISSKMLIKNWVYIEKQSNTIEKNNLINLHLVHLPSINERILKLSNKWTPKEQQSFEQIFVAINDTLVPMHQEIMNKLNTLESYNDFFLLMTEVYTKVEENGDIIKASDNIIKRLDNLTEILEAKTTDARLNMDESFKNLKKFIIIAGSILVLISITIAFFLAQIIIKPIKKIKNVLTLMGDGEMPDKQIKERSDEIGEMAAALNTLIIGLKETTDFSIEIGKGNFESPFVPLSDKDNLGNALLEMRTNLKHANEEDTRRKKEDDQRNWASQGIAKYSDILRQNNDDIEKLSYEVISNLVKYCDANQGGLFIVNNDDENNVFIEMSAAYAFNRKKFLENKIELGVGLVGRAVQEAETIYVTDIPDNYITITSGLGDNNPKSILIVPLVINDEVYGVIEMASFKDFEKYQIEFIEKVGENIASTLSTVKVNIRTTKLLEQTRLQAEEMGAQEEEMRQNMEELQATQEESARREEKLVKQVQEFERFKKQQESFIKKLDGNMTGGLVSALDEDDDEEEEEENETPNKKKKK
ncbi:MAG: GAF domain-containing protein [Bacteroidales bacterium]|nr:GAF domain-containing protein [Bacteroidales bacterium]